MENGLLNFEVISPVKEVILVEDDIPGARLCKPVEQCSAAILKRWLVCRNARITGTKRELIERYVC